MQTSLKTIIKRLEEFSQNHSQIESFGFGELYNISTKDINFPYMHVMPTQTTKDGSFSKLNLEIYLMELERGENLIDIMSDLYLIGNDIISEFMETDEDYGFSVNEKSVVANPFTGDFDDLTAGWIWRLEIDYIQTNNCDYIPRN